MRTILIFVLLAVGVTSAFDQLGRTKVKRVMPKRFLLTTAQQTQIKASFDVAKAFADRLDKFDFQGVIGSLAKSASSFLGALGPFIGPILSLFGGAHESAELRLLKQLFIEVENRFDQVDVQFAQLRQQIRFVPTQIQFATLESNINAVQSELNVLAKVTNTAGYSYETKEFKHTFDRTYASSGIKLYNGIVHGGLTTGGIFHEFMVFSSYDRKATQHFMLGTLNLLMRAAALEMTYAQLSNDPNHAVKQHTWESHFNDVKNRMVAIDNEIVKQYHNPMITDVNNFATQHPKGTLNNNDFSNQLYNTLTTKYYWRDWLLIVAPVYGSDKFANHACELNQHDNHGRNIVVASVDKKKAAINSYTTQHILHQLKLDNFYVGHGDLQKHYRCLNSNSEYSSLPDSARNHCNPYAAAGVLCTQSDDIHIHAASGRYHSYTPHSANRAYLFG